MSYRSISKVEVPVVAMPNNQPVGGLMLDHRVEMRFWMLFLFFVFFVFFKVGIDKIMIYVQKSE